jgi:hypothetical protein
MTKIVLFFKYPNFFNYFLNLFCGLIKLIIFVKNMENRELIYDLAKRLDMIIEVTKEGKYIGKFRFINDKLHKLKEDEKFNDNSEKEKVR